MVGCRLKNWRCSATSNAGTPVSAAGKLRGFKLEERKRNKRMEVSIGYAHFLESNTFLPRKKREVGGEKRGRRVGAEGGVGRGWD